MQFTPEISILFALSIISLIFNVVLFIRLKRMTSHYNSLTAGILPKTLMNALQGIQSSLAELEKGHSVVRSDIQKIKDATKLHIQQLTLKRFNPFGDTGGDQSFILAILDGNKDGVVITSLHSRENTRFYVKSVNGGVGIDHPLSEEEQKTINRKAK